MSQPEKHPKNRKVATPLVALASGTVLGVALLSACGAGSGETETDPVAPDPVAANTAEPQANEDTEEVPGTEAPDAGGDSDQESPAALDHDAALTAGLSGEAAIQCVYTYDEAELEALETLAQGAWVSPTADVYLNGDTLYWEVPQEYEDTAHVLGHKGDVYTWGTPGTGSGVASKSEVDLEHELDRLERNTSDCVIYEGQHTIFEVPADVTFQWPH